MLRIATPVAVPLVSSSNLDCSQVRVPSANVVGTSRQKHTRRRAFKKNKKKNLCGFCKINLGRFVVGNTFRLPRLTAKRRLPYAGKSPISHVIVRFHGFL